MCFWVSLSFFCNILFLPQFFSYKSAFWNKNFYYNNFIEHTCIHQKIVMHWEIKKKVLNGINSIVVRYLSKKLLSRYFHRAYLYQEDNMDMGIPYRKHNKYCICMTQIWSLHSLLSHIWVNPFEIKFSRIAYYKLTIYKGKMQHFLLFPHCFQKLFSIVVESQGVIQKC